MKRYSVMRAYIRKFLNLWGYEAEVSTPSRRAIISTPFGNHDLDRGPITAVLVVGPNFDQNVPNAEVTCKLGYVNAFQKMDIPWVIVDQQDLPQTLPGLKMPFCLVNGHDYRYMQRSTLMALRNTPHCVWVDPWFKGSQDFFPQHQLDAKNWTWPDELRHRILETCPKFVHTATVPSGLCFFSEWQQRGMKLVSLPLACDETLYNLDAPYCAEYENIKIAFVGGYWPSKGEQIDRYLKPFEDKLTIFGYSPWPYPGYCGQLPRDKEPSLYRQALLSPVINEPSVAILHGQINERVFKVLGSGGVALVDAVPAYRELFSEEEMFIPRDEHEFADYARMLLNNESMREQVKEARNAVLQRHTYRHRVIQVLENLAMDAHFENLKISGGHND